MTKPLAAVSVNPNAPFYSLVIEADKAFEAVDVPVRIWVKGRQEPPQVRPCVPSSQFVARSDYPHAPGVWAEFAACKGRRMFYNVIQAQTTRVSREERVWEAESLAICASCPVLEPCQEWAMQPIDPAVDHIAGGLTPKQRWAIRSGLA